MHPDRLHYLLEKNARSKCSDEELEELFRWYEQQRALPDLTPALSESARTALEFRLWDRIAAQTGEDAAPESLRWKRSWKTYLPLAASLLLTSCLLWVFVLRKTPAVTVRTGFGELKNIALPDGSRVTLNGNSVLTYPENLSSGNDRNVTLEGEAFFEVTHLANHARFTVRFDDASSIEVLGTEFVAARRGNRNRVVLRSGSIRCSAPYLREPTLTLQPGERLLFSSGKPDFERSYVNAAQYAAWTEGKVILNRTPLGELAVLLNESHGLRFSVSDSAIFRRPISGTLPLDNTTLLLEAIAQVCDVKYTLHENKVHFSAY